MRSVSRRSISPLQLSQLAARPEDQFYDRKAREIRLASLTKTVAAFANSDGGEIVIGVKDDGTVAGFHTAEAANGVVQGLDEAYPMSLDVVAELLEVHSQSLLLLTVHKSEKVTLASNGTAYVRKNAQNFPYKTESQLLQLRRSKGIESYETETLPFDAGELSNSVIILEFMLAEIPNAEPDEWLRKQRLIIVDRPTVAGTVLFHEEPQIHLPKAAVKVYRYDTTSKEGTRETLSFQPLTIEGDAYNLIRTAVQTTVDEVGRIQVASERGLLQVQYPRETLHEIITNAVLHRDYSLTDDIHVRIFNNRIEVESPGRLPAHVTPSNILNERFARNGTLVRLINKFPNPPNKDVGEGLNTAFAAMAKIDLQDPQIEQRDNSVRVLIRHERLASPEARVVKYLEEDQYGVTSEGHIDYVATINNSQARELTGIQSEGEMRAVLRRAVSMEQIERVPGTQKGGSKYRLVEGRVSRVAEETAPLEPPA